MTLPTSNPTRSAPPAACRPALMLRLLPLILVVVTTAWGQAPVTTPLEETRARLTRLVETIKGDRTLTEEARKGATASCEGGLADLDEAAKATSRTADLKTLAEGLPTQLKAARARLEAPPPGDPAPAVTDHAATLAKEELEERTRAAETAATQAAGRVTELDRSLTALIATTPAMLRDRLAEARKKLADPTALPALPPADAPPLVAQAGQLARQARTLRLQAEADLVQAELDTQAGQQDLLTARRDLEKREADRLQAVFSAWKQATLKRQEQAAARATAKARQAEKAAGELPQEARDLAAQNVRWSEEFQRLTAKDKALLARKEVVEKLTKELTDKLTTARKRVKAIGLTESVSQLLRKDRRRLQRLDRQPADRQERQEEFNRIAKGQIEIEEAQQDLAGLVGRVTTELTRTAPATDQEVQAARQESWNTILTAHREHLKNIPKVYGDYLDDLTKLDTEERKLTEIAGQYAAFIDRHLLWTRSVPRISPTTAGELVRTTVWFGSVTRWRQLAGDLWTSFTGRPTGWILGLLAFLVLVALRGVMGRRLRQIADRVGPIKTDSFNLTLQGLGLTVALALTPAMPPLVVALNLKALSAPGELTPPIAAALLAGSLCWLGLGLLRLLCRPHGLGPVHFRWPKDARELLARHLAWFAPLLTLFTFLTALGQSGDQEAHSHTLGRTAFILAMVATTIFAYRVLLPGGALTQMLIRRNPGSLLHRTRHLWFILLACTPIVLTILAGLGYLYTSLELTRRILVTTLITAGLGLIHELVLRWLLIAQRRLAYAEAMRKREQARKEAQGDDIPSGETEAGVPEIPPVDHASLSGQSRSLLRILVTCAFLVGIWVIWSPVLPALQALDGVTLWTYTGQAGGAPVQVPIALSNLLFSLLLLFITIAAARNLPGLLEIVLLSRMDLDTGTRYAAATLSRYLITGLGIILSFNAVGIGWSQVQFLVAALGVGLGFGLQEIFANFISGLIILFERPIRVGDTVTVGSTSGTVTQIRIRATTITDWDRKELVVPNKEFVTGQLINWSLSDPITRITVPVGIAYGSDTTLARKVLTKVLEENPLVLDRPKPQVYFLGFGDNTLNFETRAFINNIENRLPLMDQLHHAIDLAFRQAGITIAFPQRDVHLDTESPLVIRLEREGTRKRGDRG